MTAIGSALGGIQAHLRSFERSAERVARAGSPDVDLAAELVQMMRDRHGVAANRQAIRATDEMTGSLFHIVA